jgi:hypothetical protein
MTDKREKMKQVLEELVENMRTAQKSGGAWEKGDDKPFLQAIVKLESLMVMDEDKLRRFLEDMNAGCLGCRDEKENELVLDKIAHAISTHFGKGEK